jgi:hypothetical protein
MRELLLVSVTMVGIGSPMGAAFAQPAQPVGAPTQGQQAWPAASSPASANNNNNLQARAIPTAKSRRHGWLTCPSC